jgi:hypothetical protein
MLVGNIHVLQAGAVGDLDDARGGTGGKQKQT